VIGWRSRYNKRDGNEPLIIAALAACGITWVEAGPLDGWVALSHQWTPCEIKNGRKGLTKGQKEFVAACERDGNPYRIWRSVEDVLRDVEAV
jgi:hypothetical protein